MITEILTQVAAPADPGALLRGTGSDPLSTVGLALLAYGLVQLLSKFLDKITLGRSGSEQRAPVSGSFCDEDRKRLERAADLVASGDQRLQRVVELAATQQKLIGEVLDALRDSARRQEQLALRINAAWGRIGSRNDDAR